MARRFLALLLLLPSFSLLPFSFSESSTCLTVYREGGAPAVFQSPKCPRWNLFLDDRRGRPSAYNCQVAVLQGRRRTQEDRAVCALDLRVPFIGVNGIKDINVGIAAVFDGHNGAEASDMASKLLLEYFFLHLHFLLDGIYSTAFPRQLTYSAEPKHYTEAPSADVGQHWLNFDPERLKLILSRVSDNTLHLEILKESLLRTIHDIDSAFYEEAISKRLASGSTATVMLIADDQILVAYIGDSKAILCSESSDPPPEFKGNTRLNRRRQKEFARAKGIQKFDTVAVLEQKYIHVKELTEDHHPDRLDEKIRVEAAGGFVDEWSGVPRVNGQLAVSRSIGDISFKRFGVISTPEMTEWQPLGSNDSFLVVASDGVFDKLTPQDTCDLLWDANTRTYRTSDVILTLAHSLADYLVKTAFERGSLDNLAAVVVPLEAPPVPSNPAKDHIDIEESSGAPYPESQNFGHKKPCAASNSSLISVDYFNQITSNFNRLLVQSNTKKLGCFYLSENLNEKKDHEIFPLKEDPTRELPGLSEVLEFDHSCESHKLCHDQSFCSLLGLNTNGAKGHCIDPDSFEKFLQLLDLVPYDSLEYNFASTTNYKIPDFRYTLERQFGGGSYGEVWLAFHWNCSETSGNSNNPHVNQNAGSPFQYPSAEINDDNSFILKRIKVEKGRAAYLSGLREKYFGEIFLKDLLSEEGLTKAGLPIFPTKTKYFSCGRLQMRGESEMLYESTTAYASYDSCQRPQADYRSGVHHIARFVESFESPSDGIWLVFHNEGNSFKKLLYTKEEKSFFSDDETNFTAETSGMLFQSSYWHWLKTSEKGRKEMQSVILQLLMAVKACHDRGITHRDIKPENIIICFEDVKTGRCLKEKGFGTEYHLKLHLIDFGSAIDKHTVKHLYGSGPTRSEQTFAYTAPEALLNASWYLASDDVVMKYDMWSVGVVIMELILGTPNIFQTSSRTSALLYKQLEGWGTDVKELAYKFQVYPRRTIFQRDPRTTFPNVWALRLVRELLVWQPEDRISVDEALSHPYFQLSP